MTRPWALLLVLAVVLTPLRALAQRPSFGPLTWEEGSPLQRIAHTPALEPADVIGRGRISADLWLGYSNIFEQDSSATHRLFLDTERLLTAATVRWGVSDRLEVGGRLTLETTGGGVLDSFVEWYHERLGFGQANRDRFPKDSYAQRLSDGGPDPLLDLRRRTMGLDDLQLFAKWSAASSRNGRSALSLKGTARLPGRSNASGAERADAALVALGRLAAGSWYVHAMLGAGVVRVPPALQPFVRGTSAFFGLAAERSLGENWSALAQYQIASPLLRGFDHRELDWPASNLILGLAGRWGEDWSWDASFQEDLPADTPAIDFTVGFRITRTWQ
jgi:hypothetical protein